MKKTVAAVLQYDVPESSIESFRKLEQMVTRAKNLGANLVVAPETAVGDVTETRENGTDHADALAAIAKEQDVYLVTSYYRLVENEMYNQGCIFDPQGNQVLDYKKLYPAKPEVENLGVRGGIGLQVANTELGKIGMLICKDGFNKFSHFLYERLGELGVDIIAAPAWSIGWSEMNTQEYVKNLYTYGAFASRAYVLMSDCTNKSFNSYGRSLMVSPIRGILKEGSVTGEEILIEELDLSEVEKAREFDSWWQPKERKI